MIKPQPESNLTSNILVLGGEVISLLNKKNSFVVIEDILLDFLDTDTERTPDIFMDTLMFLFSMGLVEFEGYKLRLIKKDDYTQLSLL